MHISAPDGVGPELEAQGRWHVPGQGRQDRGAADVLLR